MALVTSSGSRIMTGLGSTPAVLADPGEGGGKVRYWCETVETATEDSTGSTYLMARLPSNARISGLSRIAKDAQGAVTAAVLSVGVYNQPNRTEITNSTTAFNSNIGTSTSTNIPLIGDPANYGKRLWEFTTATADPKVDLDVKIQLSGANLSSGAGTMTVEIFYSTD